jgi:hypothetical protein
MSFGSWDVSVVEEDPPPNTPVLVFEAELKNAIVDVVSRFIRSCWGEERLYEREGEKGVTQSSKVSRMKDVIGFEKAAMSQRRGGCCVPITC